MTLTLKLNINEHLAEIYRNADPSEKSKIKKMLNAFLERTLSQDKNRQKMYAILDDLHAEAHENGLTDDMLDKIVESDD